MNFNGKKTQPSVGTVRPQKFVHQQGYPSELLNCGSVQPTPPIIPMAQNAPNAPRHILLPDQVSAPHSAPPLGRYASDPNLGRIVAPVNSPAFFRSPGMFLRRRSENFMLPNLFARVPDEVILTLLKWLPKTALVKFARVSKRFYRLCMHQTLWRRIDLGNKKLTESALHRLISRGAQFMRLARTEIAADLASSATVGQMASRLTYVDLSMAVYNDSNLVAGILSRCHCLIALSMENGLLDDQGCHFIAQNKRLELLNLALCQDISLQGIQSILTSCLKLKEVHLGWTHLSADALTLACKTFPDTITRLNISGCRGEALTDSDMDSLIEHCPNLVELDISDCTQVTGSSLDAFLQNLAHLKVFHSSRCYGIEPLCYTLCGKLTELNIFGCVTEDGNTVLAQRLPKVKLNVNAFSTVARPTVGIRRTSIWEIRVRDE